MATREKVREEVSRILLLLATGEIQTAEALSRLNNWLVIKVDRELPDSLCAGCSCYFVKNGRVKFQEELDKAGLVATEPLVLREAEVLIKEE